MAGAEKQAFCARKGGEGRGGFGVEGRSVWTKLPGLLWGFGNFSAKVSGCTSEAHEASEKERRRPGTPVGPIAAVGAVVGRATVAWGGPMVQNRS